MKILAILILFSAPLCAERSTFSVQSDLVADLSDSILNDIYRHPLPYCKSLGKSIWVEGFGSYRDRNHRSERGEYNNGFGGALVGWNMALSCNAALNFFVGGSLGKIGIRRHADFYNDIHRDSTFDTNSFLLGMSTEKYAQDQFFGFSFVTGVLNQSGLYRQIHERARGIFLTPELTYAFQFCFCNLEPILTSTLRYAGFFPGDYEHREIYGTLYIKNRSIQLFTLREELAIPFCSSFMPYIGVAGRFQFSGNHVNDHLLFVDQRFSSGISTALAYGILGIRILRQCGCKQLQANIEGSYDSDKSWRVLGELILSLAY